MTLIDKFIKQPNEVKKHQIDYSDWLATGETLSSVTTNVEIVNAASGDVGEPTMTISTPLVVDDVYFQYYVNGGTDGKTYKVTFLADTSDSQTVESEIEFKVNDT